MTARKPKRVKKSAAARLRPFWFLFAVVAIAAGGAGYWAATWPGFFPKRITIKGNHSVSSQEIAARAAIAPRENIWLQNTREAAGRIEAIPYIKNAAVHRLPPAFVYINVTERMPFAVVRYGAHRVVIDRDLRVLQNADTSDALPVIVAKGDALPIPGVFIKDPDTAHLLDDYEVLTQAHVAAAQLSYERFGDLAVTMRSGVKLLLGDDGDLNRKVPLVGPILSQVAAQGKKIAAVDLRAPKTPVVVYK